MFLKIERKEVKIINLEDVMIEIQVIGKNYGKVIKGGYNCPLEENCTFLKWLDGREARVEVTSQHGWEDNCRDRGKMILINPLFVEQIGGSAQSVGTITLKCDRVE